MHNHSALMRLLGCNVYISEGRNLQLIRRLEAICSQHPQAVVLANTFIDEPYHRTGFTLASTDISQLASTVHALAQHALAHVNLTAHQAHHPRLGVLDHVSLQPLGPDASVALAAQAAAAIGQQLSQPPLQLPVYYYGAAHPAQRRLAEIRRALGYFKPTSAAAVPGGGAGTPAGSSQSSSESWTGSIRQLQLSHCPPDAGPHIATAAAGVVTLGAVPWVTNYNVPLYTNDMAAAKAVARAVSTKGGGLPGVEAMALPHGPGVIEVATNLIAYDWSRATTSTAAAAGAFSSSTWQEASGTSGSSRNNSSDSTLLLNTASVTASNPALQKAAIGSYGRLAGAGPAEVAAAVAEHATRLGLPPPGPGYITNKTPAELMALAAERLQQG